MAGEVAGGGILNAPKKAQSPLAGGLSAENRTDTPIVAQTKQFANLQARLALRGHELVAHSDGSLLIHRWGLHRRFEDLTEVEQFAAQVGAA